MTSMEPIVYLVDEDRTATDTIHRLAGVMNLSVQAFTSGREFLESFDRSQCGCLVTELKVSDLNGLRILEQLAEEGTTLPVIFMTAHATVPMAVRAMRGGAFHFLEKPCHEQELWDGELRRAAERCSAIQERLSSLTVKEEVLWMIGEGKPNRTIAAELNLSIRTIEVRRNALIKKLGVQGPEELMRLAMSLGNGHSKPQFPNRFPRRRSLAFRPLAPLAGASD
jgi:FixJ family two-component response regulator